MVRRIDFESFARGWRFPKYKRFQALMKTLIETSKKECVHLTEMNNLCLVAVYTYMALSKIPSFFDDKRHISDRYANSLVFPCLVELIRTSLYTVFFSSSGFYRSAYNNIRYFLESTVQTFYIDFKHRNSDFFCKVEILREVEDKAEYRGVRLIRELEPKYGKDIEKEYKRLSKEIHASYRQVFVTVSDFQQSSLDIKVDCEEVSKIYNSMKVLYDIFFLLFLRYFPEVKELLESEDFIKLVKKHELKLMTKALKV